MEFLLQQGADQNCDPIISNCTPSDSTITYPSYINQVSIIWFYAYGGFDSLMAIIGIVIYSIYPGSVNSSV